MLFRFFFMCSPDDFFFASLRLISPVIKNHGIDYERTKFQDKLNDGTLTLERTEVRGYSYKMMRFILIHPFRLGSMASWRMRR
jgi:hypothetical protein